MARHIIRSGELNSEDGQPNKMLNAREHVFLE